MFQIENRDSGTDSENPTFDQDIVYDILNDPILREIEIDTTTTAVWEYRYDANQNQILLRQPEGNEETATYDERDLLYARTEGANDPTIAATTILTYDPNGNTKFTIDATDNDGDGLPETTENVYDGWDRLHKEIDAASQTTEFLYDVDGNLIEEKVIGTEGGPTPRRADEGSYTLLRHTKTFFDERSRRVREDKLLFASFAPGLETIEGPLTPGNNDISNVWEYDRSNRILRMVDDRGNDIRRSYNGMSEPILLETEEVHGSRNQVRWTYDRAGNAFRTVETEVRPDSTLKDFETITLYDALSRAVRTTDPAGQTSYQAYDSRGYPTITADAKGPILSVDPTGVITGRSINAPGNTTRMITDGLGRMIQKTSDIRPKGVGDGLPSFGSPANPALPPNSLDLSNSANPDGMITQKFIFDGNIRLTEIIDDNGNKSKFRFDALDRVIEQEYADGTTWHFKYDRDHNRTSIRDPKGTEIKTQYDNLGRNIQVEVERGLGVLGTTLSTMQWDGLDRPTRYFENNNPNDADDDHVLAFTYDSLSHPLSENQDNILVNRQYDGVGNKLNTVFPDALRRLERDYDRLDRCTAVTVHSDTTTTLCQTDFAGPGLRRITDNFGNGVETTFHYDAKRRIKLMRSRHGAALITGRGYTYDRNDMRISERWLEKMETNGDKGRVYVLDSLNRMTEALSVVLKESGEVVSQGPPAEAYKWQLDGVSNWVMAQTPKGSRNTTFNVLSQDVAFGHDGDGNRSSDANHTYVYDGFNRLVEVWNAKATIKQESYTYDTTGRRVTRTVYHNSQSTVTRYVYDADHVIEERTGSSIVRNYHGEEIDRLIARENSSDDFVWFHGDAVNSTTTLTDNNSNVLERYEYTPFGEVRILDASLQPIVDNLGYEVGESSLLNPYLFLGRRLDGTGLYFFRHRYFDPKHGRFLQRDARHDPLNFGNLYAYAGNNPLAYIDSWGLSGKFSMAEFGKQAAKHYDAFAGGFLKKVKSSLEIPNPLDIIRSLGDLWGMVKELWKNGDKMLDEIMKGLRALSWKQIFEKFGDMAGGFLVNMLITGGVAGAAFTVVKFVKHVKELRRFKRGTKRKRHKKEPETSGGNCGNKKPGCFIAGTLICTFAGAVPIEQIEVGQRVLSKETGHVEESIQVDMDWYKIEAVFVLNKDKPNELYKFTLLRSPAWLSQNYDPETHTVHLNFEELDVTGMATVLSLRKANPVRAGPGRVVTGTVSSLNSSLYELRLHDSERPIRATGNHPFYSKNRENWVRIKELKPEEEIETLSGTATVESRQWIPGEYKVYNLEVEGTHTYYVDNLGILTHNNDDDSQGCPNVTARQKRKVPKNLLDDAARRSGIDPSKIEISDGVARTRIGLAEILDRNDIRALKEHLRDQDINRIEIESGLLANEKLDGFLRRRVQDGKLFYGGRVRESSLPNSDFVIEFDLD